MAHARGRIVLFSDADLSTPIEEVEGLADQIRRGADVAVASRALPASNVVRHQAWPREYAGKTFNLLVQLLVIRGVRDTQCGFKLFTHRAATELFSRLESTGFEFDVELLSATRDLGFSVAEVPVTWLNHPTSHVRFLRDSSRMALGLLRIRGRRVRRRARQRAEKRRQMR